MYELRCLGEASLRDPSGALLHFRSRKHFALLTYLALNADRAHRRERLAGLLWSDSDDSRARHSLSQALYAVRRLLNNAVRIEGEDLELESTGLRVDAIELERLFRAGEARAAADLYRGDFLEGFWLRGARGFEEWSGREKARVGALAREALREAIRSARESCEWAEVRSRAERLIQLDPFDEAAYAELMRALWMLGDRAAALERYDALERVLAAELETAPAPETVALAERIRKRPVRGGWGNRPLLRECENPAFLDPPFVGRKAELAALAEEWARVERGESRTVVLIGDAGIGKTRLAEEFIRSLELSDVCVLRGRCYEVEQTLPYGPVAEALREGLDALELSEVAPLWLAELARIVPEVSERVGELPVPAVLDAEGGRRRLYEGIAQVLRAACEARSVLLFVDDLHWADDSSLALLHYLHRRVTNGFYLLTAHRPEEIGIRARPSQELHTLADERSRRLHLDTLDPVNSSALVDSLISEPSGAPQEALVHRLGGGHPLLIMELARSLAEEGVTSSTATFEVPKKIQDLLKRQSADLSRDAGRVLNQAACLGTRSKHGILGAAAGLSPIDLDVALEELSARKILESADGIIRFRHDLIRQAVWSTIGLPTRRALHLRSARALIHYNGPAAEIAVHLSRAGRRRRAYVFALRGARTSEAVFAFKECADLLILAIENAPNDVVRTRLSARLVSTYLRIREYSEARPWLLQRCEWLTAHGSSRLELIEAKRDLVVVDTYSGRMTLLETISRLLALHEELLSARAEAPKLEAEILGSVFWASARSLKPRVAEDAISKIRSLHARCTEPTVTYRTGRSLGIFACYHGDLKTAESHLREAVSIARSANDEIAVIDAYIGLTILLPRRPNQALAEEILEKALPLAQRHADPARTVAILCNCGACYMYLGELDRAEALLEEAKQILDCNDDVPDMTPSVYYNLGYVARAKGLQTAETLFKSAQRASESAGTLPIRVESLAALGLESLLRGDVRAARDQAAKALRIARKGKFLLDDRSDLEVLLARLRRDAGKVGKALDGLETVVTNAQESDIPLYLTAQLARLDLMVSHGYKRKALIVRDEIFSVATKFNAHRWVQLTHQLLDDSDFAKAKL